MDLLDIYRQSTTYQILAKDIQGGTLCHTYMLVISDEILANSFAKFFAMQLMCEDPSICCKCNNCNKIQHNNMADVLYFPQGSKLTVEESRQIVDESFVLPYEADKKLFVINNFDKATPQSQNALLKVLEEPTESNMFLIITESLSTVLPTIQSRAKKIIEKKLQDDTIREYIKSNYSDLTDDKLNIACFVAGGDLSVACKAISDDKYQKMTEDIVYVVNNLKASSDVLKMSNTLAYYKDSFEEVLETFMQVYLELDKVRANAKYVSNIKFDVGTVGGYNTQSITYISHLIVECMDRYKFNCSITGIIDYLLFGILEAKFRCK